MSAPDHGPMTDDLDAMTYDDLQRTLRLALVAGDVRSLLGAVAKELDHRDRQRTAATRLCAHPADHRCIECATDAELLTSLPAFPGAAR